MKILVTGGSGFIGTNLVDYLLKDGNNVLSIDKRDPQEKQHFKFFRKIDILDYPSLKSVLNEFSPTHVVHLAARTDLHEKKDIKGYNANINGVENLVKIIYSEPSVERCIFTSTKLVCPTDYTPKSFDDYCPNTLYGESKVMGERIVRNSKLMKAKWCIVRPTSIWGPWSLAPHIQYGKFFIMISKGQYFHPGKVNSPKSFGYVGNTVFQIKKLLHASNDQIHQKIFYLSDYDIFTIKDWANTIALKMNKNKIYTIPEILVNLFAWIGDIMKHLGIQEPPFSSFRLKNMQVDTSKIPMESLNQITGKLPYTMEQGVEETIAWFEKMNLLN